MMNFRTLLCLLLWAPCSWSRGEEVVEEKPTDAAVETMVESAAEESPKISPQLQAAIDKLPLPGVKINPDEWSVDVDGRVCLVAGMLELIVCTKDTKEHESIIAVDAKPSHIHTALLLLGAVPGNPAMNRPLDAEMTRFMQVPPQGGLVDVYLVIKDEEGKETEHPISDFIKAGDPYDSDPHASEEEEDNRFSTHSFIFAGSVLYDPGEGPRRYVADESGHVISITTFGDELLCLPGFHDHSNDALAWQVDGTKLPGLDSKVILRLRPQKVPKAEEE